MRVRVQHSIGDLADDYAKVPSRAVREMVQVTRKNVHQGNMLARKFARASAGRHGKNYFKRITSEMTGPLDGEYGPTGAVEGRAVGAGWRNGAGNTDLPKSADVQGPKFAKDAGNILDGLF